MREFFQLNTRYKFEYNDLRAFITVVNVILIMCFGLSVAWFGLTVAAIGLVKDFVIDRRINSICMHTANLILNLSFLLMY